MQGEIIEVGFTRSWWRHYPVLNGEVRITGFDILASNGIIHVIDKVLIPPSISSPTPTITELAVDTPDLSTLVTALSTVGLEQTFQNEEGPFTVFAPTNTAFEELGGATVAALLEDPPALTKLLTYHAVNGKVVSSDLETGSITSLAGFTIDVLVTRYRTRINLNGDTLVLGADNEASNGVVHTINKVLIPPGDLVEIAKYSGVPTLVSLVAATNLTATLQGPGPLTVFAPSEEAFGALDEATLSNLAQNPDMLREVLLYHVVAGNLDSRNVEHVSSLTTVQGDKIQVGRSCFYCHGIVINDNVNVQKTDILATNGIVHVIDSVLIPPNLSM